MKKLEKLKGTNLNEKNEMKLVEDCVKNFIPKNEFGVKRIRKFIPEKLIATVIQLSVERSWSYMVLAKSYGLNTGVSVTKQAIWKATQSYVLTFLHQLLSMLLSTNINKSSCNNLKIFGRILVEDSTTTKLPNKFKSFFPGSSNQNGSNSSFKVQTLYDIMTESFINFTVTPYTDNDLKMSNDIFGFIKAKDLILRDMGYFSIDNFKKIIGAGAFFISRLKQPINLYTVEGKKINLFKLLKDGKAIDMIILLGSAKLPVRFIAMPLTKNITEERKRKANKNSRTNYTKLYKFLLGWNLMITNIEKVDCSVQQIYGLYSLRWRIESIFKMWKSYMNFKNFNNMASLAQLYITIISRLIFFTIVNQTAIEIFVKKIEKEQEREVSLFQLYDLINNDIQAFSEAILDYNKRKFYENLIIKNCLYEKRKDRVNYTEKKNAILALL